MVNLESKRLEDILKLINGLILIILINLLVANYFFRIDLTEEKRYSISDPTREMLKDLQDIVYVEVYLDGDLPAGFKRLQLAVRETLEEFRIYSNNKVQSSFVDPDQATSAQSRDEYMMSIAKKGIQPTDVGYLQVVYCSMCPEQGDENLSLGPLTIWILEPKPSALAEGG